jgi:5-methylcytosine-specific restriction endonuclease McrA
MHKINYPEDATKLKKFRASYANLFPKLSDKKAFSNFLDGVKYNRKQLDLKTLVVLPFADLLKVLPKLKGKYKPIRETFEETNKAKEKPDKEDDIQNLFNYSDQQQKLAAFFMNQHDLQLSTCHFCGIDYINAFADRPDYEDEVEFVNEAPYEELIQIKGIAEKTANRIREKRNVEKFSTMEGMRDACDINASVFNNLLRFRKAYTHNHFTLDHVLPKAEHPYFALCLYNLVPCCYGCNSKFKTDKNLKDNAAWKSLSPSSPDFSLDEKVSFSLCYDQGETDSINDLDIILYCKVVSGSPEEEFLDMFKIQGRYSSHKKLLVEMLEKKDKYPESHIEKIAKMINKTPLQVRKDIFGSDLFPPEEKEQAPLTKLKRDIAIFLKIKGVIKQRIIS